MRIRRPAALAFSLAAASILLATPAAAIPIAPGGGSELADTDQITMTLTLTGAAVESVEQVAQAIATPGNARFRKPLSRQQVRARFGAPAARVDRVKGWARKTGFTIVGLDLTGTRLTISGSSRTAKAAFGVGLRHRDRGGVRVRSATAPVRIPTAVSADIAAVTGLNQNVAKPLSITPAKTASCIDLDRPQIPSTVSTKMSCLASPLGTAAVEADQACSTFWGQRNNTAVPQKYPAGRQSNYLCGYNGAQLRSLYGLTPDDTGAGQTIVVVGAYNNPSTLADANAAFAANGVPALPASRYQVKTYPGGGSTVDCGQEGWNLEQALDVQTAHTIAPAATIVYAAAPDCTQLEETVAQVVADPAVDATIVSNSWGMLAEPADTASRSATNAVLARAAVLGIGTYFASGDYGDTTSIEGSPGASVSFPASSPWVTAVGGTTTAIGANNEQLWQTGWEDAGNALTGAGWSPLDPAFVNGAGGAQSRYFAKPSWQNTVAGTTRTVPDIAALADPYTGFFIGITLGGQYLSGPVGGTSLAAPIIASLAAVAQAKTDADIGLLAPLLYANATSGKATTVDVEHVAAGIWTPGISGDLPTGDYLLDVDAGVQSLKTTTGYDLVTGLGTPGRSFLSDIGS